jgi:hypothetical protein
MRLPTSARRRSYAADRRLSHKSHAIEPLPCAIVPIQMSQSNTREKYWVVHPGVDWQSLGSSPTFHRAWLERENWSVCPSLYFVRADQILSRTTLKKQKNRGCQAGENRSRPSTAAIARGTRMQGGASTVAALALCGSQGRGHPSHRIWKHGQARGLSYGRLESLPHGAIKNPCRAWLPGRGFYQVNSVVC